MGNGKSTAAEHKYNTLTSRNQRAAFNTTGRPGGANIRERQAKEIALAVGAAFDERIAALVAAADGIVVYGPGGLAGLSWDKYSKGWHRSHGPARWNNAGARIESGDVIVENFRGTEKFRVALDLLPAGVPVAYTNRADDGFRGLNLDGDLFAVKRYGIWERFAPIMEKGIVNGDAVRRAVSFRKTGIAIEMLGADLLPYFEHGANVAECRAEHARKLALRNTNSVYSSREVRAVALMRRLCGNAAITRASVKANGACEAGIAAWLTARGFASDTAALPLKKIRGGHPTLEKAIGADLVAIFRAREATRA